jgi:hypothetical protein
MAFMTIVNLVPLLLYYFYRALTRWGGRKNKGVPIYIPAGAFVLYIISEYIVLWFSRTREFYADRFSGAVTKNPNALTTALIKIAYGLAAQDSRATSTATADNNELIGLNLSGSSTSQKSSSKKEKEQREIAGSGALAVLGIRRDSHKRPGSRTCQECDAMGYVESVGEVVRTAFDASARRATSRIPRRPGGNARAGTGDHLRSKEAGILLG